jgi:hypothetical protein
MPKLRTKCHFRILVIFVSLARISHVKDCVEQGPFSWVASRLVGFHIPCILGDWWLSTLFRVFCHWNLSLASWIVSTYMICLLRSFWILSAFMRQISWVVLVSSVTLNVFCVPFCYPSRLSHSLLIAPCCMKSWELRRRPRNFDFCFTLRLLYSRKAFGLDIVTRRQCFPVSGIDLVLPLS